MKMSKNYPLKKTPLCADISSTLLLSWDIPTMPLAQ